MMAFLEAAVLALERSDGLAYRKLTIHVDLHKSKQSRGFGSNTDNDFGCLVPPLHGVKENAHMHHYPPIPPLTSHLPLE